MVWSSRIASIRVEKIFFFEDVAGNITRLEITTMCATFAIDTLRCIVGRGSVIDRVDSIG